MGRDRPALRAAPGTRPPVPQPTPAARLRAFSSGLPAAAASVCVVSFFAVFFAWPVAGVIAEGLGSAGIGPVADLLASPAVRSVVWFTFWQAAASTALTVLAGMPGAWATARLGFRGRRAVRALVTVPFVLPTVVVAAAFESLFDRFGVADGDGLRLRHTAWAILIAHVFFNYAVVVRIVGAHWAGLDARMEDQARVLGAGWLRVFGSVTLPRLVPSVVAASAIVFLFSFTSFGVVLVLGGPGRATVETEIYRYALVRLDLTAAAALAGVQLAAVIALVGISTFLERSRSRPEPVQPIGAVRRSAFGPAANLAVMAVLLGLPLAVLVERSLSTGGGYSLRNYGALLERVNLLPDTAAAALGNSLMFAAAAAAIAVAVGGSAALMAVGGRAGRLGRLTDAGLTLPLGVSAVTVGLGILLVLDRPPLDLRTSVAIVPIAHAVVGIPFVVRTVVPMLRAINPRAREAAAVLGARPGRVRREIDLRVASRGLAVGAAFAFAVSLGEFGATSFVPRRPETLTAPLALFRLLGTPGTALRGQAMALAVVLMALTAAVVFVVDLVGDARDGAI